MLYKYVGHSLPQSADNNIIPKREDGFYQVKIASFELISEDDYIKQGYELQSLLNAFNSESAFMKRVNTGCLYGEYGFPNTASLVVDDDGEKIVEAITPESKIARVYSQRMSQIDMRRRVIRYDSVDVEIKTDNDLITTINLTAWLSHVALIKYL